MRKMKLSSICRRTDILRSGILRALNFILRKVGTIMTEKIKDSSVAIDDNDMAIVNEIAEHEILSKKQVVHNALSHYYNLWVSS